MTEIESDDVIEVEGERHTVERVDHHNNRIHLKSGLSLHGAALHAESVRVR